MLIKLVQWILTIKFQFWVGVNKITLNIGLLEIHGEAIGVKMDFSESLEV